MFFSGVACWSRTKVSPDGPEAFSKRMAPPGAMGCGWAAPRATVAAISAVHSAAGRMVRRRRVVKSVCGAGFRRTRSNLRRHPGFGIGDTAVLGGDAHYRFLGRLGGGAGGGGLYSTTTWLITANGRPEAV